MSEHGQISPAQITQIVRDHTRRERRLNVGQNAAALLVGFVAFLLAGVLLKDWGVAGMFVGCVSALTLSVLVLVVADVLRGRW